MPKGEWIAVAVLSVVLFLAFFSSFATYTEVEHDWLGGEDTTTTIPISGYELADGALHRTLWGTTVRLTIGSDYPVLWVVPLVSIMTFTLALIKRIPVRPLLLGASGLAALVSSIVGYAQLIAGEPPEMLSSGTFAPDYGLVATIIVGALISLIGFRAHLAKRKKWISTQ
jgi:hypothetical protein